MTERAPRRRLGRGLEALLGPSDSEGTSGLLELDINSIAPNPYQPRRSLDDEELDDLARSIQAGGLLQPVVVRPADGRYQLIAGERRLRAVQRLGWATVPAVVRTVDDRTILTLALVENLQRDDLSPIDEALAYERLVKEFQLSQQEVADAVGRDRSTVANAIRLLKLPATVQALVHEGALSEGHARALVTLNDRDQVVRLAREAAANGWSVRDMEERARRAKPRERRASRQRPVSRSSAEQRHVEDALRRRLQTDVRVLVRGARGRLEIAFYSNEDLARLLELILGEPLP